MPISLTVTGNPPKPLSAALIMRALELGMQECDDLVANRAREIVHVRTGGTRQTIRTIRVTRIANGVQGGIEAGGAGRYLEDGTATFSTNPEVDHKPYPILPVNKKALAWPGAQGPSTMMTGSGRPISAVEFGTHASGRPPITGTNVRLSGQVRTPIKRLLRAGAIPFNSVYIVRRGVMHPGIRPRPFMRPALDDSLPKFSAIVAAALRRVLGGR